jgi:hydrogenase maturation protease
VLVLGIGNILRKDDGIGVHIVNYMADSGVAFPPGVDLVDGGTAGVDLVPLMQGYSRIIIVDALAVDDAPGSVYRFTPEGLKGGARSYSLHDFGVKNVIDCLRIMGENPEIEIIGVVPEDISAHHIGISESLQESIPRAVREIVAAAAR